VLATFRSVAVVFDPLRTDLDTLKAHVLAVRAGAASAGERPRVEVPVEYGEEAGPDLAAVAAARVCRRPTSWPGTRRATIACS
jgi:allophanate hydrolase subunit 1